MEGRFVEVFGKFIETENKYSDDDLKCKNWFSTWLIDISKIIALKEVSNGDFYIIMFENGKFMLIEENIRLFKGVINGR